MDLLRTQLVYILLLIKNGHLYGNFAAQDTCQVAEEGKEYNFLFKFQLQSEYVNTTIMVNNKDAPVAKCDLPNTCISYYSNMKTYVTINATSLELTVFFQFDEMSRNYDGNWNFIYNNVESEATLSVFKRATAECHHSSYEETLQIICSSKKCFPEPTCESTLVFQNMTTVAAMHSMNESSKQIARSPAYYQTNCSTFLSIHNVIPGEYLIVIWLYQNISGCGNGSIISTNYTLSLNLKDRSDVLKENNQFNCECEDSERISSNRSLVSEELSCRILIVHNGSHRLKLIAIGSAQGVQEEENISTCYSSDEVFLQNIATYFCNNTKYTCQIKFLKNTSDIKSNNVSCILNITNTNVNFGFNELLVRMYPNLKCDHDGKYENKDDKDDKRNISRSVVLTTFVIFTIYFTFTIYAYIKNCFSDGRNKSGTYEVEIDNMYIYNVDARHTNALYSTIDKTPCDGSSNTLSTLEIGSIRRVEVNDCIYTVVNKTGMSADYPESLNMPCITRVDVNGCIYSLVLGHELRDAGNLKRDHQKSSNAQNDMEDLCDTSTYFADIQNPNAHELCENTEVMKLDVSDMNFYRKRNTYVSMESLFQDRAENK